MWAFPSEAKEEVSGGRRSSVSHPLRKVPLTVDLLMFVSGRTLNFYPLSNFQVQVSPTFLNVHGKTLGFVDRPTLLLSSSFRKKPKEDFSLTKKVKKWALRLASVL